MAKLITPHLKDVEPTPTGLRPVSDRLIEVALSGAPLSAVRITVTDEQGAVGAVLLASVGDDNGKPYWTDLSVAVAVNCQPEVTSRVNRLLKGFAFQRTGLTTNSTEPPKIGMNWRVKRVAATYRRRSYALPVHMESKIVLGSPVTGSTIITRWNVRSTPVVMETNVQAGFSPLTVQAPTRRTARRRTRSAVTPSVTPKTPRTEPTVAPMGSQPVATKPSVTAIPKAKPSVLPKDHPGVMAELAAKPYTVHVEPEVQRKLDAAYLRFTKQTGTVVIGLRGPSGAGKTLAAMNLAAMKGLPFMKVEAQGLATFADWYGSVGLTESNGASVTAFVPSDLTVAIDANGPYGGIPRMVLVDEITRAPSNEANNAALAMTDGHGTVYIPDARTSIVIDPQVLFVYTANIGSGFNGSLPLDRAVSNRVRRWILVDYPSPTVEAKIIAEQGGVPAAMSTKVVQVALQLRAMANRGQLPLGPSTRQLVAVCEGIADGLTPVEAYECGFVYEAGMSTEGDDSDTSQALLSINAALR